MQRKVNLLAFLLLIFHLMGTQFSFAKESNDAKFCSIDLEKRSEYTFKEYIVKISYAHERMCQHLEIVNRGKVVFHEEGVDTHFSLGSDWNGYHQPAMMNMTGHGTQLVISKWTGGAHCCMSLLIFELADEFRKIAEIEGGNFDPEIVDLNHDGIPEIRITDDFLAYRFSSFASSAQGAVILKYVNGGYVLAEELMKQAAPQQSLIEKQIPGWRKALLKGGLEWPPESFIQALTDLIFTGNVDQAGEFVNRIWPRDLAGKDEFLKSYTAALSGSRYYSKAAKRMTH